MFYLRLFIYLFNKILYIPELAEIKAGKVSYGLLFKIYSISHVHTKWKTLKYKYIFFYFSPRKWHTSIKLNILVLCFAVTSACPAEDALFILTSAESWLRLRRKKRTAQPPVSGSNRDNKCSVWGAECAEDSVFFPCLSCWVREGYLKL